jgi:DNA-binding NtrC family response regulator
VAPDRKTVLVADADADMRDLLLRELTLEGVKVEASSTGVEMLQKFYRVGADALIVEGELPDIETGRIIDAVKRASPSLPIIVIAANRSEEFEKIIRQKGIFYYATKPFSIELFKIAVRDALSAGSRLSRAANPGLENRAFRRPAVTHRGDKNGNT